MALSLVPTSLLLVRSNPLIPGQLWSRRGKRMESNLERSRCSRSAANLDDERRSLGIDSFHSQSYGLAERLLREGNQMHMAVSRRYHTPCSEGAGTWHSVADGLYYLRSYPARHSTILVQTVGSNVPGELRMSRRRPPDILSRSVP